MATVTVQNNLKRDLIINHEKHQLVFPAGKDVHDAEAKATKFVAGLATAELEVIEAAKKKYQVVAHWFSEGWLKVVRPQAPAKKDE